MIFQVVSQLCSVTTDSLIVTWAVVSVTGGSDATKWISHSVDETPVSDTAAVVVSATGHSKYR